MTVIYDKPLWCECKGSCICWLPQARCFESRRRYDFIFRLNGRRYIVEFDGEQHFRQMYWHSDTADFLDRQDIDKVKNHGAILSGFTIIRVSNGTPQHITSTLTHFLSLDRTTPFLGVDDELKYSHMRLPLSMAAIHHHLAGSTRGPDMLPMEIFPPRLGRTFPIGDAPLHLKLIRCLHGRGPPVSTTIHDISMALSWP